LTEEGGCFAEWFFEIEEKLWFSRANGGDK
jgi:hypothetical protein